MKKLRTPMIIGAIILALSAAGLILVNASKKYAPAAKEGNDIHQAQ